MRLNGGIRSHLVSSKFIVIGPVFGHVSVWPMCALVSQPFHIPPPYPRPAGESSAYMGQAEKLLKMDPITMNLDETKWDRTPPDEPHISWGFRGPSEAKFGKRRPGRSGEGQDVGSNGGPSPPKSPNLAPDGPRTPPEMCGSSGGFDPTWFRPNSL